MRLRSFSGRTRSVRENFGYVLTLYYLFRVRTNVVLSFFLAYYKCPPLFVRVLAYEKSVSDKLFWNHSCRINEFRNLFWSPLSYDRARFFSTLWVRLHHCVSVSCAS